ncbi:MAG: complex I NDUFA9 subunit family protein [Pseudomonadota bacterium]
MTEQLYTVIGGSGFVGRYIVQALAEAGHRVRVAVRHPNQALFLKPLGAVGQVLPVAANVTDEGSIARAVEGADGVVNLVGILHGSTKQFEALQVEGAERVARLAKAAGAQRFVQMSAIGADAERDDVDYARTKGEGEEAVKAAFPEATILRPSIVFGPEDAFLNRFADLARKSPFMPLICGSTQFQPVYVVDVADATFAALTTDTYQGQTYWLGGPKVYSFKDLLTYIMDEAMQKRPFLPIPAGIAEIQGAVMSLLPNPPLTRGQVKMLRGDNVVPEGALGIDAFGITPTPVESIAPSYLVRHRPHGRFSKKDAV